MKVETRGAGVLLPDHRIALDTQAPGYASIVSHAHGDHIPWEATSAWASPETCDLLAVRKPDLATTAIPWREPVRVNGARVTIHPAGHILGSACVRIEAPSGESILYTGDTRARPSATAPAAEYPEADVLVVESTFGLPIFRFPGRDATQERMAAFARATLEDGAVPVFLGYSLGKAQEIIKLLERRGIPAVAHGAAWSMCEVYARHGVRFERARPYAPGNVGGAALVVPPSFRQHPMVTKLDARTAYCSGWALLSKSRLQMDADSLVPMSDHADYGELFDIVARVRPSRILPNHGYSDIFSHLLRKLGHDAQPLTVGHAEDETE